MDIRTLIADNIFAAIDILVDRKLENLNYAEFILGHIKEIIPSETGAYKVEYQNRIFTAYAVGEQTFQVKDLVQVVIPHNSFDQQNFILGLASTKGGK